MVVVRFCIQISTTSLFRKEYLRKYTMSANYVWKGVPMAHIIGSQTPWGAPEFPLVQPGYNHSVLYHIPANGTHLDKPPKPQLGKDKWDQEHVKMPFSIHSLYPVENSSGETRLRKRWDMIHNALNKPLTNCKDLANAILSYNTKFKNKWKFRALFELFEEHLEVEESQYFFDVTLPEMTKLALSLPQLIQSPIPLLKQHKNQSVSLSQQQISSLLANAFFCTFPRRNTTKRDSEYASYPHINFNVLYECSASDHILEKLKCICHYFRRVCTKVPVGVVTVSRRSVRSTATPDWSSCANALATLPVHVDAQNTIEDAHGLIQVDFANKYLGGGVLGYGSVQEEIRFMICPELMISMLFTEVLRPNEALMMIGCEQFSKYSGYGSTFQWSGDYEDSTPHDSSGRRRCAVLAIDARPFNSKFQEYKKEAIVRDLNKAWIGFSFYTADEPGPHYPGVATGNWGCGAFGGSAHLKALIQMLALARAGRPMAYYTFGDVKLQDDIITVYELLARHNVTVGQLYDLILKFCEGDILRTSIYKFLEQTLQVKNCVSKPEPEPDFCNETEDYELPLTVELALNRSPDMFTPDDHNDDQFITPAKLKIQSTEVAKNNENSDSSITENNMSTSVHEISDSGTPSHTERLFSEIEKLDEDGGKLNLNSPQKSLGEITETAMDVEEKLQTNLLPHDKKKLAKKITDYFSKKII